MCKINVTRMFDIACEYAQDAFNGPVVATVKIQSPRFELAQNTNCGLYREINSINFGSDINPYRTMTSCFDAPYPIFHMQCHGYETHLEQAYSMCYYPCVVVSASYSL